MEDVVSNREKLILQKFVSAEDERKCKMEIRKELYKQKINSSVRIELNSKKIFDLQERLAQEYNVREKKQLIKSVQEKSAKLHDSIMLHKKVIKQLLEQESKFIRKPKKRHNKVDRLPYLKNAHTRLIESVQLSESEQEEIEMSLPQYFFPKNLKAAKGKFSLTPAPGKPKGYLREFSNDS